MSERPPAVERRDAPCFEDLEVGAVLRSRIGRTITEADNVWFTCLTMNTNQAHFNAPYAANTPFGRPIVNSTLTLALVTGLTVPDTSERAVANLGWSDVTLPNPVFVGDTLWAETEILDKRESRSNAGIGIVTARSRGLNQRGDVVIEFRRTFMLHKRGDGPPANGFPQTDDAWRV